MGLASADAIRVHHSSHTLVERMETRQSRLWKNDGLKMQQGNK